MGIKKSATLTVFLVPFILMLVPISDVISVMYKRYKTGNKIFSPDKNHLHHRLINLGFSVKGILAVIYSLTALLGCFAILIFLGKPELAIFMFIFALSFTGLLFFVLNRSEKRIALLDKNIKMDNKLKIHPAVLKRRSLNLLNVISQKKIS